MIALLESHGIVRLADVRRHPGSRRNPQFGRDVLDTALAEHQIRYEWWGAELGGRREPVADGSRHRAWRDDGFRGYADHMDRPEFRAAFSHLLSVAAQQATAVMCSETLWWRCHRRLLADCAELRGTPVVHLLAPGRTEGHRLHPAVRRAEDGWPVYDLGVQSELSANG